MSRGRVVTEVIESKCLRGNPAGDPARRELPVYLPPGYDDSDARYPVVFVLTGFTGRGVMQLNRAPFTPALDERLDALIGAGRIRPVIAVLPDCFTRYGGSQYLDSEATGCYETHVIEELVPFVDGRYRTAPGPGGRAVMGKSSGGYGSLVLAMRHPDVFGLAACHSGDMGFEYCYLPDFPAAMIQLEKHGGLAGFLEAFDRAPKKSSEFMQTLNIIAMSACYGPNPAAGPHRFDLPFDERTGALREQVWSRWLAWDPVRMVDRHADALRRVALFIDCGTRDEFRLYAGSRMLTRKLRDLGIDHEYQEFEDTHMSITYRYDESLRFLEERFHV
jgi:enterochelin esterase-like enzyme